MNRRLSGRFGGLWRHPDFMKLWTGQTISAFGSHVTGQSLPFIAILLLSASPEQLGLMVALTALPGIVLGLVAGVWIDRLPRRKVMIAADLTRMLILLSVPAAVVAGKLGMELIILVAILTNALNLIFDLAYRAALPGLVERRQLLEGNTKLAASDSLAEIGGPGFAGLLIQWVTAPLAVVFDALSFLVSAVSLALIRQPEPPAPRHESQTFRADLAEGFRALARHPALRTLGLTMAARSFFGNFYAVLYSLFALRELGLTPAGLGVVIGAGGVGALAGALLAQWMPRRLGLGRTLTGTLLFGSLFSFLIPLAGGSPLTAAMILMIGQVMNDSALAIFGINEMALRQTLLPDRLLGRANATIGFLAQIAVPLGALAGGALAGWLGIRGALWIAGLGMLATSLVVYFSPVRRLETEPTPAWGAVADMD